jgi:hypothetical protein
VTLPSLADPVTLLLAAGIALARGMDLLSTWLVTPNLALEANPLMRRLRWRTLALLNLPLLGLPFLHHGLSITFIVASLLVAGTNLANGALARGMGERRQLQAQLEALRRIGLFAALAMNSGGMLIVAAAGGFLMALSGDRGAYAWWGGLGVLMCGVAGLVHLNWQIVRLHRKARDAIRRREAERRAARRRSWRQGAAPHRAVQSGAGWAGPR